MYYGSLAMFYSYNFRGWLHDHLLPPFFWMRGHALRVAAYSLTRLSISTLSWPLSYKSLSHIAGNLLFLVQKDPSCITSSLRKTPLTYIERGFITHTAGHHVVAICQCFLGRALVLDLPLAPLLISRIGVHVCGAIFSVVWKYNLVFCGHRGVL